MEQRLEKLEHRVSALETRVAVAETNIKDIKADLDSIKNNTTWILRLVIGTIITALVGLVIKGGM
jgi:chromosome segregation ATPase